MLFNLYGPNEIIRKGVWALGRTFVSTEEDMVAKYLSIECFLVSRE